MITDTSFCARWPARSWRSSRCDGPTRRSVVACPTCRVVLASGYSHVLAQEGAHGFELLHKPYSAEQLSRILRRVSARGRRVNAE